MPPQKLKGKDNSSDLILQSNRKQVNIFRANTYDFWLSGQYGKYNSNIFIFHSLGPFPSKMLNSLFWSPTTAVHRFDAWDMTVPGLYISWSNGNFGYCQRFKLVESLDLYFRVELSPNVTSPTFQDLIIFEVFKHRSQGSMGKSTLGKYKN